MDLEDYDDGYADEDDFADFGLQASELLSDQITGRLDRFHSEGYEIPDIVAAATRVLADLAKTELVSDPFSCECQEDLLLLLKENKNAYLGDMIHGLALGLTDFTTCLRSDFDDD